VNVAAIVLLLIGVVSLARLGRLREWHHLYLGALLFLVPWTPSRWVSLVIMADDALQHVVQLVYPNFRSPLHRAYGVAWRLAWVRRLNVWLDARLK
jgi:hypothetical protein